jgi:hypothetical protein
MATAANALTASSASEPLRLRNKYKVQKDQMAHFIVI